MKKKCCVLCGGFKLHSRRNERTEKFSATRTTTTTTTTTTTLRVYKRLCVTARICRLAARAQPRRFKTFINRDKRFTQKERNARKSEETKTEKLYRASNRRKIDDATNYTFIPFKYNIPCTSPALCSRGRRALCCSRTQGVV